MTLVLLKEAFWSPRLSLRPALDVHGSYSESAVQKHIYTAPLFMTEDYRLEAAATSALLADVNGC